MEIAVLIPAAGLARRMRGSDKLLEPVVGEPLLRRQARIAGEGGASEVIVTLPAGDPARAAALDGLAVTRVGIGDPSEGMAASIRAGAAAAGEVAGLMILLADLPEIEAGDIATMIAAFRAEGGRPILRATSAAGGPGHPVIFPGDLLPELAGLRGDTGPRPVIAAHRDRLRELALPGARAVTDLDTPEDWAAWRAATGR
jgi:CTP:molybdopterin cytidylyltransferase MocA